MTCNTSTLLSGCDRVTLTLEDSVPPPTLIRKCKTLCRTYGIAESNFIAFTGFQETSVDGMIAGKQSTFSLVPVNNQAHLVSLMTYLQKWNSFTTPGNDVYSILTGLNQIFGTSWAAPRCSCGTCALAFWR